MRIYQGHYAVMPVLGGNFSVIGGSSEVGREVADGVGSLKLADSSEVVHAIELGCSSSFVGWAGSAAFGFMPDTEVHVRQDKQGAVVYYLRY